MEKNITDVTCFIIRNDTFAYQTATDTRAGRKISLFLHG